MPANIHSRDISAADGAAITLEAKAWSGTSYKPIGAASMKGVKGDCSGSTWRIYVTAGFPYDFKDTSAFEGYTKVSGRFRRLNGNEPKQEGDILLWPGHMAIFSTFVNDQDDATRDRVNSAGKHWAQINDMWSATKPGGLPYGAFEMKYFKAGEAPVLFRYQK